MKNFFKLIGNLNRARGAAHQRCAVLLLIIALVAMIGFSMIACGDGGGGGGGSGNGNGGGGGSGGGGGGGGNKPAEYSAIYLKAGSWDNADGSSERWSSFDSIKLSDITTFKPKQGDVLRFKISGISDKELKSFQVSLFQMTGDDWDTYKWLANSSSYVALPKTFNDRLTDVTLSDAPNANGTIYVELTNVLWLKDSSGDVVYDSGEKLPPNTPNLTLMATITNFKISLVLDDDGGSGGNTPGGGNGGSGGNTPGGGNGGGGNGNGGGGNGSGGIPTNWTAVADSTFGTAPIYGIAYGNGKFVAVGQGGKMAAYSADGVTWTAVDVSSILDIGTPNYILAIAYGGSEGNEKFVVGQEDKIAYSAGGVTWTAVTDTTFGTGRIRAIAYGNNKFVAVGDYGIAYSADGVTWTASNSWDTTMSFRAIAYGNNMFVTTTNYIGYSPDGITWTETDVTFGYGQINAIAYGNGKWVAGGANFIAGGNNYGRIAYSSNGVTWTFVEDRFLEIPPSAQSPMSMASLPP